MIHKTSIQLLWGKTGTQPGDYHPLVCHMIDSGLVARSILEMPDAHHLARLFSRLLGIDADQVPALVGFLVSLHDLGKASPSFQAKSTARWDMIHDAGFEASPATISGFDHGEETLWFLRDLLPSAGAVDHDLGRREADRLFLSLAMAVGAHHGTFYPMSPTPGYPEIKPHRDDREPWREKWRQTRETISQTMMDIFLANQHPLHIKPGNLSAMVVALNGITILADWIGSDEKHFPHYSGSLSSYPEEARERVSKALRDRAIFSFLPFAEKDTTYEALFPEQIPPRGVQAALGPDSLPDLPQQALAILEAPTGEGKTEAALLVASRLAALGMCRGLYFGLPTVATSNQMYERVASFLENHLDSGMAAGLLLVNGQADLHEEFAQRLLDSNSLTTDPERAVIADRWLLPRKRSLLSPYGVGTVDQAMMAALNVRHVALRLLGLAAKVLIIDEVHAYDLYMSTIIFRLLAWARVLGSSVILLSATLPSAQRERLIAAYGGEAKNVTPLRSYKLPYPCITLVDGTKTGTGKRTIEPKISATPKTVVLERRSGGEGMREDNARYLLDAVEKGGCAAWICNTVREAQQCYLALNSLSCSLPVEKRPEILLFHARFPLGVRRCLEEAVVGRFGRDGDRPSRAILIATQVVEQSLDLDFDLMVSQLAPVDLLIQRIGRLWRHQRSRPDHLSGPRLILLMPPDGPDGPQFGDYGRIYEPYVLLRSLAALFRREYITSPDDIRELVELVYGDWADEDAAATANLEPGSFRKARRAWDAEQSRQQDKAKLQLLGLPDAKGTFAYNLGLEMDEDASEMDEWVAAATRLAEPSVRLVLIDQNDPLLEHPAMQGDGKAPVDLTLTRSLLMRSVAIPHRPLVNHVATGADGRISRLGHIKGLRGHWLMPLQNGGYEWEEKSGRYRLELSEVLGVAIERRCAFGSS